MTLVLGLLPLKNRIDDCVNMAFMLVEVGRGVHASDASIGCSVLILTPKRRPGRDTASLTDISSHSYSGLNRP